ncbi:hypothetical protein [Aquimarina sp. MMG016]|uniref:hypothetical protein n=1 Tax=Aquimarina sp. MMG016 TaxID=2822690 RepID=UPI001B39F03D|nr:hypothetical protein [Aquimarina sp. MMG016]MBQ4818886.1 hypothetical protein [Aquimarina sp. MMG016]
MKCNIKLQRDKRKRCRAFIKALEKISSQYGLAIDTFEAPYVLENPQTIIYEVDDDTESLESMWEGKEVYNCFLNKNLAK